MIDLTRLSGYNGLDLLNIVLMGIAKELHRLLSTLLSMKLTIDEKLGIIKNEYHIPVDDDLRKDVSAMCNLSQGIREKGRAEGEERIILNMYNNNFTFEQIALATSRSVEEIKAIIEKREPVLA